MGSSEDRRATMPPVERRLARQNVLLELARMDKSDLGATMRRITELESQTLGVERVSYWEFSADRGDIVCNDLFVQGTGTHDRGLRLRATDYPDYFKALAESRTVAANDAVTDPRTREFKEYLQEFGVTSMMDVPVRLNGAMVGVICHEHTGPRRRWTNEEQQFGASIADMLSLALEEADRRRLLDEAQRHAAEWAGVVSAIADAVWVFDARGRVTFDNQAAQQLLGAPSREVLNLTVEEYSLAQTQVLAFDGRKLAIEEYPIARALRGETVKGTELSLVLKTGERRYVRVSAGPVIGEGGRVAGAVAVASDITERVEFDRLKEQFIAVAAHELKTPVTIMKGYAQALLRTSVDMPDSRRSMLDAINRGADRIGKIVRDLLDVTRLQLGRYQLQRLPIELSGFVREIVDDMARTTSRHHIHLAEAATTVVGGDRDRLAQVLVNLLDNAIKYSPVGGEIEVTVATQESDAVVSVRDHGVGIPAERQARIFDRFYRAHAETAYDFGGMGVGLYISRELVEHHGGKIWFESADGAGSIFHVALPLAPPVVATSADG